MAACKYLERLCLGQLVAVGDDARVQALGDEAVGLLEQLAHQEHHGRRAVTSDVVLGRGGAGDHDGGRVLYLHLSQ